MSEHILNAYGEEFVEMLLSQIEKRPVIIQESLSRMAGGINYILLSSRDSLNPQSIVRVFDATKAPKPQNYLLCSHGEGELMTNIDNDDLCIDPHDEQPIRNKQMLDEGKPNVVIAFPGGRGTVNMCKLANEAGVKVIEVKE